MIAKNKRQAFMRARTKSSSGEDNWLHRCSPEKNVIANPIKKKNASSKTVADSYDI